MVDGGRNRQTRGGSTGGGRTPRGIRNNNPLNIEYRANNRWQGQTGSDGRFATFSTPEQGIRAAAVDIRNKGARGLDTVAEIIGAWAPPTENNTDAYAASIARAMGVRANDRLNLNDPTVLTQMIAGMIQVENGEQPYSVELIREGVQQALNRERARGGR
ncbi:MAG: structural protein P5 [Thermoleophilia bacterium]|nr:structural protein P5 [Thermoleophilia bacterium]